MIPSSRRKSLMMDLVALNLSLTHDEHVQSWSESLRQSGRLPTVDAIYLHEKGDLGDVMMVGVDEKE